MTALAARLGGLSSARLAAAVGAVSLAGLMILDAAVRDLPEPRGDELIYERMATEPFDEHTYVFAFRVAIPWLVHVLPFDHDLSFGVLAWLCSAAAGAALFLLLDHFGFDRRVSVLLGIVLAISPPMLVASLREGRNPDPLTGLVMVAGALFIVRRQPPALAVTMLVGAANRESALFLGPLAYAVWADRAWDPGALRRAAAASLPAVLAFAALRLAIPTVGREQVPGYGSLVGGRFDVLQTGLDRLPEMGRRLLSIYGPLWLLAPLAFRRFAFARRGVVLLALCAAACTFALDWGRIAFIAAPVMYAAAAWTLDRRPAWFVPVVAACAALVLGYAGYMELHGVDNIIDTGAPPYPVR